MYFENLDVWQRSVTLCTEVYKAMAQQRDFGFKDQITQSSLSVASNIAEGYERDTDKDRVKFLSYAKASCAELRTQIHIGININYIDKTQGQQWIEESKQLSKMIYALMKRLVPGAQLKAPRNLKN